MRSWLQWNGCVKILDLILDCTTFRLLGWRHWITWYHINIRIIGRCHIRSIINIFVIIYKYIVINFIIRQSIQCFKLYSNPHIQWIVWFYTHKKFIYISSAHPGFKDIICICTPFDNNKILSIFDSLGNVDTKTNEFKSCRNLIQQLS